MNRFPQSFRFLKPVPSFLRQQLDPLRRRLIKKSIFMPDFFARKGFYLGKKQL